jgi:hypothetical protein
MIRILKLRLLESAFLIGNFVSQSVNRIVGLQSLFHIGKKKTDIDVM